MKIALTGATGFVGRATVQALLTAGHSVRALVRDKSKVDLLDGAELVQGDLSSETSLLTLTQGADAVLHVAGAIAARNRDEFFAINAAGTAQVAKAVRQNTVPRLVYVSSLSARAPELSAYGASKRGGEDEALNITATTSVLIIRPPAVYGPGDKATLPLIKAFTKSPALLPGTSHARFSLIMVGDLAQILAAAVESSRTGIIEVSDGQFEGYSWSELAQIAGQAQDKTIKPIFIPKSILRAGAGLVETMSGWGKKIPPLTQDKVEQLYHADWVAHGENWPLSDLKNFNRGFPETLQWYRAAGWLPS